MLEDYVVVGSCIPIEKLFPNLVEQARDIVTLDRKPPHEVLHYVDYAKINDVLVLEPTVRCINSSPFFYSYLASLAFRGIVNHPYKMGASCLCLGLVVISCNIDTCNDIAM